MHARMEELVVGLHNTQLNGSLNYRQHEAANPKQPLSTAHLPKVLKTRTISSMRSRPPLNQPADNQYPAIPAKKRVTSMQEVAQAQTATLLGFPHRSSQAWTRPHAVVVCGHVIDPSNEHICQIQQHRIVDTHTCTYYCNGMLNSAQKRSNQPKIAALAARGYPPSSKALISTKIVRCMTLQACFCCRIPRCCAYLQSRQPVRTPECITHYSQNRQDTCMHIDLHTHNRTNTFPYSLSFSNACSHPTTRSTSRHLQAGHVVAFASLAHCVF
jgi:hypothetical protein